MRKLMWFSIGFTIACAMGVYLLSGLWLLALAILCGGVATIFSFLKKQKTAAVLLLGLAVGLCWLWGYDLAYLGIPRSYDGKTVSATVEISDYSYDTVYGVAADGTIVLEDRTYKIRVYLNSFDRLVPGDVVEGEVKLRYTLDGGEKGATYHQGKGIFLLGYVKEDAAVKNADDVSVRFFPAELRKNTLDLLDSLFPEDTMAFARALLLGDSSKLTYEVDTDFKVSGIRHVIAVSGLHVSILFSLVYMMSGRKRVMTAVLGIPVLVLFAAVAGFTPSIVRACIMQGLMILALLLNKEYDPATALAFAVLIMLAANPITITSVSFQLSVGCIVGIFLFSGKIHSYLLNEKRLGTGKGRTIKARLARWLGGSVSVSLSAMMVTMPLSAYYFGMVSIVGILTNLLALWVISFVFYGIMAACILGSIWLPLGKAIAWIVSWLIRYVLAVADVLSAFTFSAVYTNSIYIVIWLVFCYVLLAAFLLSRRKHPVILAGCMLFGLCFSMIASWLEPRLDNYRVTVLDVGQGQSILVQHQGKYYLVDCGGDTGHSAADAAAQALLSQGVDRLDGVIITHYDADHAGGVMPLLTRIDADNLYLPDIEDDNQIRDALKASYADRISWITENTVLTEDTVQISLYPAEVRDADNESSMCILFQMENCDILITGDRSSTGERALMERTDLPELELLVAGHHGSNTSTCFQLLAETKPEAAVISVGADNSYGHPAQDVLNRLKLFGCRVYRTDTDGTILFRG